MTLTHNSSAAILPFEPRPSKYYLKLTDNLLRSPAWESLSVVERALYVDVAGKFKGYNNGRISYSIGDGAKALRISRRTTRRALKLLQKLGLLVRTKHGYFDQKTEQVKASEWYLPEYGGASNAVATGGHCIANAVATTGQCIPNAVATRDLGAVATRDPHRVDKEVDKKERGLPKKEAVASTGQCLHPSSSSKAPSFPSPTQDSFVPRTAPNGDGDSVWVKYDTLEWDKVERFGHRAVGKVFIRYGRVEGAWILAADLRAIETLAAAEGATP
jgi:hypothetical protein